MKKLTKTWVSAKPYTLQVYSFNGAGGVSDQLPMKQKKGAKGVSKYPFLFHEKKTKPKSVVLIRKKTQLAILGTNQTVTTTDNKIIHRKNISKPVSEITQEPEQQRNWATWTERPIHKVTRNLQHTRFGQRIGRHGTGITGSGYPQEERCIWKRTPHETGKTPVKLGFTRGTITVSPVTKHVQTDDHNHGKHDIRSCRPRY